VKNNPTRHVVMEHSSNDVQRAVHQQIIEDDKCPFCIENITKYHSKPILETADHWLVTKNAWSYKGTTQHHLLILKRHTEHVADMNTDEWSELLTLIQKYGPVDGGAFFMRFGDATKTCSTVVHLHCHIISGGNRESLGEEISESDYISVRLGYKTKPPQV
jgi:diadenosine tetraphosphate (Ap4A) HIT family hydrolase